MHWLIKLHPTIKTLEKDYICSKKLNAVPKSYLWLLNIMPSLWFYLQLFESNCFGLGKTLYILVSLINVVFC